jgi:hypothetical protein
MRTSTTTLAAGLLLAVLVGCASPAVPSGPGSPEPAETPVPGTLDELEAEWAQFEPFEARGTGEASFSLPDGAINGMITATHTGTESFWIEGIARSGGYYDIVQSPEGPYDGVAVWNIALGDLDAVGFHIIADGEWTFRLEPLTNAPAFSLPLSGTMDAVYLYPGGDPAIDGATVTIRSGEASVDTYFGVVQRHTLGLELHENGLAGTESTVQLAAGPSLFAVRATVPWEIVPE